MAPLGTPSFLYRLDYRASKSFPEATINYKWGIGTGKLCASFINVLHFQKRGLCRERWIILDMPVEVLQD
jgi:hypothetical protein